MSVGFVGSKHTVFDIYPLRRKKVLLLVDPQNILGATSDFQSTVATVDYLLKKNATVVIASSFGPLCGSTLNLSKKEREAALEAFRREDGLGYTHFFSSLTPNVKVRLLASVSRLAFSPEGKGHQTANTGKTSLFGTLSTEEKRKAIAAAFPRQRFAPSSTLPFVEALQKRFPGIRVLFAPDCLRSPVLQAAPGEIVVLENLRFYKNEISPDASERMAMAQVLATGIDIYINDSFATTNASHASNVELPKLLRHGAAGQSLDRELAFYSKFCRHPARPLAVVVAGSDVVGKLKLIRSLAERVDRILVAGAIAMPFLAAKGIPCGQGYPLGAAELTMLVPATPPSSSYTDRDDYVAGGGSKQRCSVYANEILELCAEYDVDVVLPIDHVGVPDAEASDAASKAVAVASPCMPADLYSVDCGPHTTNLFLRSLRGCRTVFWTGTLGDVGHGFAESSKAFAAALVSTDIVPVIAGRDTAEIAVAAGVAEKVMHVSGGGAACLEALLGYPLPGVESLSDVAPPVDPKMSVSVNELLRHLPLFVGCNSHQLRVIAKKFVRCVHARGDLLVHCGDRHVRMVVVAHGGLSAHFGEEYSTTASRFVGSGQTIGMYDFITQASASETVRVVIPGTVTYQLSGFAMNDLLNAYPDLAAQLFQNISDPLRKIINNDYEEQQTPAQVSWRNSCRTRVPIPAGIPRRTAMWEDILQDLVSTLLLQRWTMRFTPYVDVTLSPSFIEAQDAMGADASLVNRLVTKLQSHCYLPVSLAVVVVRNIIYHKVIDRIGNPLIGAIAGSIAVAPMRVWSYGIAYGDINFKLVLEEAVCGAAVSCAPLAAYRSMLALVGNYEKARQSGVGKMKQLAVMAVVKLLVGLVVFPIIYQRNFIYTPPNVSRFWKKSAFAAYEQKQILSLVLRSVVHRLLTSLSASP